jgi:hypothetical protein
MTKHRTSRRRSQKGGLFGFFESQVVDPNAPPKQGWGSWFSGATTGASGALTNVTNSVTQGASNLGSSIGSTLNSTVDLTGSTPTEAPVVAEPVEAPVVAEPVVSEPSIQSSVYNPLGGRRRRKMKGGKGLVNNASPVSGLNVAKPTYWIGSKSMNGGSRRKRRQRKSKKSRKSRKSRKTRRH